MTQPVESERSGCADREQMARLAGKYMTFKLANEEYGLEILTVREIIGVLPITRVPRTSEFVRGIINLRGKVIPVFDLRLKFGLGAAEATEQSVIIVVQVAFPGAARTIGIFVDQVLEVLAIDAADIEPAPNLVDGSIDGSFILGVGKVDRRVIFLLDIAKVLGAAEAAELSQLARS